MRASSLSNPRIISTLNRFFVPVYISNEDYSPTGSAAPAEKAERMRIYAETIKAGLSSGTVHVYIIAPDGRPIDSMHVARAYKIEELSALLDRTITRLKVVEGKPLVAPTPQSRAPWAGNDSLVLHLVARNVERKNGVDIPHRVRLGETNSANWGSYPVEDWIVLDAEQQSKLLPRNTVTAGQSWDVDAGTASLILTHVYPSTENNDLSKNKIERLALRATVLTIRDGTVRARLDGQFRMKHTFYEKEDDLHVEAALVGLLEFDAVSRRIKSMQLATNGATHGRRSFGVVVQTKAAK